MEFIYLIIIVFIILFIIFFLNQSRKSIYENFYTNNLFWNTQLGNKKNMSYDLRGDVPIPYFTIFPFNMSSTFPIMNRPLYSIS